MTVSLGFFSMIFGWLFDVILQPIFRWLGELLGIVIGWVFDRVLGPIVEFVLKPILKEIMDIIFRLLAEFFYSLLYPLYMLVDYIQKGFDILIGLTPITYHLPQGGTKQFPLIEIIFNVPGIRTMFLSITILGVALAFVFAILATIRSTLDFDFENKRPISQVLKSCMKSMLTFMLVPIFVLFMLRLSGILLSGINDAISQGNKSSLGTTLFLMITFDAAKDSQYNGSNASMDEKDPVRFEYMKINGGKKYNNMTHVRESFNIADFDFVVGFLSAIFALIILGMCMILFVQRLFEVIMLYIISPLFVSVMPLDDGEKFNKWREVFLGKVFMGFGAAIAMRVYLMILPTIMNADVQFKLDDYFFNYLVKLIFMLGGMYTVYKSSGLLTSIISAQAAQHEESSAQAAGGKVAFGVMGAAGMALGAVGLGGAGGMLTEAAWSVSGLDDLRQAYKGPINKAKMDIKEMGMKKESAKNADTLKAINRAQMGIGAPGTTSGSNSGGSSGSGGSSFGGSGTGGSSFGGSYNTGFGGSPGSGGGGGSSFGLDDLRPESRSGSAGTDSKPFGGGSTLGNSSIGQDQTLKSKSSGTGNSYTGSPAAPKPFTPPAPVKPEKDDDKDNNKYADRTDDKEQPQMYKQQDEKKREPDEEQKPKKKKKQRAPTPPPVRKTAEPAPKQEAPEEEETVTAVQPETRTEGGWQGYREPIGFAGKAKSSSGFGKTTGGQKSAPQPSSFESKLDSLKISSDFDKKLGRTSKDKDEPEDDDDSGQKF